MTDKSNMLTPDADALAERVARGETVTVKPSVEPADEVIMMSYQSWLELGKRHAAAIAELEARLATANERIADLRDADKRAVKIAAEECNKQKAELERRLREVEETKQMLCDANEQLGENLLAVEAENARLRAALEAVEWHRTDTGWAACPWCLMWEWQGHKPDCARQAALSSERAVESEGK